MDNVYTFSNYRGRVLSATMNPEIIYAFVVNFFKHKPFSFITKIKLEDEEGEMHSVTDFDEAFEAIMSPDEPAIIRVIFESGEKFGDARLEKRFYLNINIMSN